MTETTVSTAVVDQAKAAVPLAGADDTPTGDKPVGSVAEPAGGGGAADNDDEYEPLITDEEFEKHQDNSAELRKLLNTNYTKKMQESAAARRLFRALEANPDWVLEQIATARGIKLVKGDGTAAKPADETPTPVQQIETVFKQVLGDEATAKVMPALQEMFKGAVKPLEERITIEEAGKKKAEVETVVKEFEAKYPDFRQHEQAIVLLSTKIQPHGLSPFEYLEILYSAVTKNTRVAEQVGDVVKKMQKGAKAVAEGNMHGEHTSSPSDSDKPTGKVTLREALQEGMKVAKAGKGR